jgi:glycosyltransferase involved in cell wall biosynthesis
VGHFAHPPNRDAAVWLAREIMPDVVRRRGDARLRIVGTAPPPAVQRLAGDSVEVIPDAPSIEPHLAAAAVVVAPVRTGGGMRMKVLQAMAAGKAVVTTPRGTEGFEAAGEELPLAVAEDADGIAVAASELLADPDRRRLLGAQARRFAQRHHSPEAWAERLERSYAEAREIRQAEPHG